MGDANVIVLRPVDQEVSVNAARALIAEGVKRILLQAPCGFGKTVVGAYVARSASERGKRVLFLVHREELFVQASRTFQAFDVKHSGIAAGLTFDRTIKVQIGMIDTVRSRIKREIDLGRYDIVIVDECHHAVSSTWKFVIDHFADRGAVILGLSATPERLSGEPLGDIFDRMIPGPSVRDLISRGALSEYKYFAPPTDLDLSGVHTKYGDFVASELAAATDRPQIIGDVIRHYRMLLGGKRAIVFAVNVEHSQHVVEQFNAAGIPAAHIDGTMDRAERRRVVKAFERGDILILSNVQICTEGFDVKACDGVILLRATQSLSLHIQMVGRAMRPHESKAHAIIIDHVGNVNRHGLPDADHAWTLEGKKKRSKRKKDDEDVVAVAQCPKCYTCHEPAPACPACGHVYVSKSRQIASVDGELQEITPEMREAMSRQRRQEQGRAQTVDELIALGHHPKAAEKIVQARAAKQDLISSLIADLTAWSESTNQYPLPTFGVSFRDIRFMKPKALNELRGRFEAHKAAYLAGDLEARKIQPELL